MSHIIIFSRFDSFPLCVCCYCSHFVSGFYLLLLSFFLSFFSFVSSVCYYLLLFPACFTQTHVPMHSLYTLLITYFVQSSRVLGTCVCGAGWGGGGMVPVVTRSWDLCETRNDVTHPWGVCDARDDTSCHASLGRVRLPRWYQVSRALGTLWGPRWYQMSRALGTSVGPEMIPDVTRPWDPCEGRCRSRCFNSSQTCYSGAPTGQKHFQSSGSDEITNCRAVPDTVVQISNMPATPNIWFCHVRSISSRSLLLNGNSGKSKAVLVISTQILRNYQHNQ